MNPDIEDAWRKLDALALAIGQPDIVGEFLSHNRALMFAYIDVYRQLTASDPPAKKHRESTPTERMAATG